MILHIHNGDASADVAKQSSIRGEHFAWREALIDGPAPNNIDDTEWRRIRAQHLSEAYSVEQAEIETELRAQEDKLASFAYYDEVVLWFEHDLFCHVHLIYLLDWFGQRHLEETKLSLIYVGSFPGRENFRGLGELSPEEMGSLFPSRQPVTTEQFNLANRAFAAYRSSDPRDIEIVLQTDTTALPFLKSALQAHLRRFPSTINGLGQIENQALRFVSSGGSRFPQLFDNFSKSEPIYGLGDAQLWFALRRMSDANQPLLTIENVQPVTEALPPDATFRLTDLGQTVIDGEADYVLLNGIDEWIGGVYLSDERNLWRWDPGSESIVLT
jgi:hypothetical protein